MILVCEVLYDSLTGPLSIPMVALVCVDEGVGWGVKYTYNWHCIYDRRLFEIIFFIRWKTDCTYVNFIVPFSFIRTSATLLNPLVQLAPPHLSHHICHKCSCVASVACGFIHAFSVCHRAKLKTYFKQTIIRSSSIYTCYALNPAALFIEANFNNTDENQTMFIVLFMLGMAQETQKLKLSHAKARCKLKTFTCQAAENYHPPCPSQPNPHLCFSHFLPPVIGWKRNFLENIIQHFIIIIFYVLYS